MSGMTGWRLRLELTDTNSFLQYSFSTVRLLARFIRRRHPSGLPFVPQGEKDPFLRQGKPALRLNL